LAYSPVQVEEGALWLGSQVKSGGAEGTGVLGKGLEIIEKETEEGREEMVIKNSTTHI
jgi:hypothetical protein